MIFTIRSKFTFWFIATIIIVMLLAFGITEVIFQQFALKSIDESLSKGSVLIEQKMSMCINRSNSLDSLSWNKTIESCLNAEIQKAFPLEIVFVQIKEYSKADQFQNGRVAKSHTLSGESLPLNNVTIKHLEQDKPNFETLRLDKYHMEVRLLSQRVNFNGQDTFLFQFCIPTGDKEFGLRHPMTLRQHIFFAVFIVLLVMVSIWGFIFMKKVFSPIRELGNMAKKITDQNLSQRIEGINSKDEIGELAQTFNQMIERLDTSFQQIKQFSGDVSHELKTPLTAMKGELEVILRKEREPFEYKLILKSLVEETDKLNQIVEDLLFLSHLDYNSSVSKRKPFQLDDLLMEVYENHLHLAGEKNIKLEIQSLDETIINGEKRLMQQVLNNLLLNAIKYTPEKGYIGLSLKHVNDEVVCSITDTGIGIDSKDLNKIFDRFYRADTSRSKVTGGSGLGLAIAKRIMEIHNGEIKVVSIKGKGSKFDAIFY
jgi:heavy metal sensor kinase